MLVLLALNRYILAGWTSVGWPRWTYSVTKINSNTHFCYHHHHYHQGECAFPCPPPTKWFSASTSVVAHINSPSITCILYVTFNWRSAPRGSTNYNSSSLLCIISFLNSMATQSPIVLSTCCSCPLLLLVVLLWCVQFAVFVYVPIYDLILHLCT